MGRAVQQPLFDLLRLELRIHPNKTELECCQPALGTTSSNLVSMTTPCLWNTGVPK
jgi:hypothetical protein